MMNNYLITNMGIQCGHCGFLQVWNAENGSIEDRGAMGHKSTCCGLTPRPEPKTLEEKFIEVWNSGYPQESADKCVKIAEYHFNSTERRG